MRLPRAFACAAALLGIGIAQADDPVATPDAAATLQARYAVFKVQPVASQYHRPLRLESSDGPEGIAGEIHALVEYPFAVTAAALKEPSHWCEILLLHLDTKDCGLTTDAQGTVVRIGVVTHYDQPASGAYRVEFRYRLAEETPSFLQVRLDAAVGPLGTSNYHIVLEAMPAEDGRTFIRMSYSYSYGVMARIAMGAYFATFGRNKVGFTVVAIEPGGQPRYITGMRGVVERNTMRYYLAVEAYLGSLSAPRDARLEKSLRDWYTAVEHYPRQLHEMEQGDYLAMKRKEFALQQS
jgi:hypothetical protein